MTTFGNPYDNQYHATSVQSGKSKRAAEQNQKEARRQKKAKARGGSVEQGSKHGGYGDKDNGGRGGRGGRRGGGGSRGGGSRSGGGGGGGGGGRGGVDFSPGLLGVIQAFCAIAAVGQLVVGIIHTINLFESLENNCDEDASAPGLYEINCVGESLWWSLEDNAGDQQCWNSLLAAFGGGFFSPYEATVCTEDNAGYSSWLNWQWRAGVFSLVPDVFVDNWTPLIFGLIAIFQCIAGYQSDWVSGSYLKCLLFHVVMMLFACFGYAGQAGIIIGFIQAFAAFLILIAMLMKMGGYAYPTIYLCC